MVMMRMAVLVLFVLVFGLTLFARHVTELAAGAAADTAAEAAAAELAAGATGGVADCDSAGGRFLPESAHVAAEDEAAAMAAERISGLMAAAVREVRVVAGPDCNVVVFVEAAAGDGRGGAWSVTAASCRSVATGVVSAGGVC